MEAIDHLDLVVTSVEDSLPFYQGLLGPLGYVHLGDIRGERGERVLYLSRHGGGGSLSLRDRQSSSPPAPYDRYDLGLHHVAFAASSRAVVDDRAAGRARTASRSRVGRESTTTRRVTTPSSSMIRTG